MTSTLNHLCSTWEAIVSHVVDPVIAVDASYRIILINTAAKQHSHIIFGKQVEEGANLEFAFSHSQILLDIWKDVLCSAHKTKAFWKKFEVSCHPVLNTHDIVVGAFGIFRRRDERLDVLTKATKSLVWQADAYGQFFHEQPAWEEFTGQSWITYRGFGWMEAFHTDDQDTLRRCFSDNNQERFQILLRLWNQDQSYHEVTLMAAPLMENGEVQEWIGTCADFPKIHEESKRQSNFEMLADRMPHLVWTSTADGNVDYYNQRWYDYTGKNLEQTKDRGWMSVFHPDDLPHYMEKWKKAHVTGSKFEFNYRLRRSDNTYRWHTESSEPVRNEQGDIVKWLGTCTDIEDPVQASVKLSTLKQQLNLMLTAAQIGVWHLELESKDVTVDQNILELFNIRPESFDNRYDQVLEHIHKDDRDRVNKEVETAAANHTAFESEFRIEGTHRTVAGRGEVFFNAQGQPQRIVGINWDITSRKQLEQEKMKVVQLAEEQGRKRVQDAEEHRKRLEEFVDTICHEIRNPLNGITGMVSLMKSSLQPMLANPDLNSKLAHTLECVSTIEQCAEQQKVIVDEVLDLSKVENDKLELNPTVFSLKPLLEHVRNIFRAPIKSKNLECLINIADGANCTFQADSNRLSQIIINLFSNAIKFTASGSITIAASKETLDDEKRLLHFSVTDSGIGMTNEETARLFNKFSQANLQIGSQYGGSGLGLVISKKLVERMGGTFRVCSTKGQGTQFMFSVACVEVSSSPLPTEQPREHAVNINFMSKRVLVVEDNPINQKILSCYLQQQNCRCLLASNGLEALMLCSENQFDVIFMDIEMPIMGGMEATRQLRQKPSPNQLTPIIGLSGNARKEHVDEAIKSGMNAYLTKPYHKNDMYRTVMEVCDTGDRIRDGMQQTTSKRKAPS